MVDFKRILVPIDFSLQSSEAIICGKKMARALQSKLYLLNVIDCSVVESAANIHIVSRKISRDHLVQKVEKKFSILKKEYALDEVEHELVIRTGGVFMQILNVSNEIKADLIIVYSCGGSRMFNLMFGSTSEKLVHYSHAPVLVLKQKPKF